MNTAKHVGRIGALAVALGIGNVRRAATRMTVSVGVAVLVVMVTVVLALVSTVSPVVRLTADSTALILGGTSVPTPDDYYIETVKSHFIAPTHPGQEITYVAVTTPEEGWPVTGLLRLIGFAVGPQSVWGPGGAGWPEEPWWKLSGLFDLTYDQSFQAGVGDLEQAMAKYGNDHLVIYGYSQGAVIANLEKPKLAEQYPPGTKAPDIDFVLSGDPNVPNGGIHARFPGLYVPIGWTLNGPEPTDTQFHTDVITRQYDGLADFPLYPLNLVADLNALLGLAYVHLYDLDVSLPADPTTSKYYQGTHGDTSYYFFETPDLPLFAPLRTLGVPESLIDVVEPFFRAIVELGYDRTIPPWEPTPARLIPPLNPASVATDLVNAIGEGINNAAALIGSPPLVSIPAPVTLAAPATETAKADVSPQVMSTEIPTQTEQVMSTGASKDLAPSTTKVNETVSADVSQQVTPTETVTEAGQMTSTKTVANAAKATEVSTGPTAANAVDASASASTPKPAKPAGQPAKPRPVVRDSLGVGRQLHDRPHRGDADQPTTRGAAASDVAATAGPSSVPAPPVASSSTGSNSSDTDSSDSDAGES
jgi:PE-PPE domain